MPNDASPPVASKSRDALLIVRIWAAFIALCHIGGLAGVIVPLFIRPASGWDFAVTLVALSDHIVALVTATMLLIGLRKARFALLVAIIFTAAHAVSLVPVFAFADADGFGFGLLLYVPPLVLIHWRPQDFR
jgi:hypothetical protein